MVCDATFLGKRKSQNQRGVLVFRDAKEKENLIWKHVEKELVLSKGYPCSKLKEKGDMRLTLSP